MGLGISNSDEAKMDAFAKLIDEQSKTFDLTKIISQEIEEADAVIPPSSVYKYYPPERSGFFSKPSIRFTQRSGLNDPFELSRRWTEFGSVSTRKVFADHIKQTSKKLRGDKDALVQIVKADCLRRGQFLSDEQLQEMRRVLGTKAGKMTRQQIVESASLQIDTFVDLAFLGMNSGSDRFLEEMAATYGIFSVSDTPTNEQLWGLYARSNQGFVVELDAHHQFFRAPNGRHLLRQVKYTDQQLPELLQNPLYIFLVKNQNWAFEREWRILRRLVDCDEAVGLNTDVHVANVKPGMVRSVIFGAAYDQNLMPGHIANLLLFDPTIKVKLTYIDRESRAIAFHDLSSLV